MIEGTLYETEKEVLLERKYLDHGNGWTLESIYEFRHYFVLPESLNGKVLTVYVDALDKNGEEIEGSSEAFYLWVR
jgi:hypothetical protein